jgi:hypothetical protein
MPDDFEITIDTKEVDAMLAAMPLKLAKGAVREALQAAGDVMLGPMKSLCPERTEGTEDESSNALQPGVLKESLTTQVQIGSVRPPRVKVGAPIETNQVAWLVENGFMSVKAHRQIPGVHFMAAAFDESAEAAVNILVTELGKVLKSDDKGGE